MADLDRLGMLGTSMHIHYYELHNAVAQRTNDLGARDAAHAAIGINCHVLLIPVTALLPEMFASERLLCFALSKGSHTCAVSLES